MLLIEIAAGVLYTGAVWYVGRNWSNFNSITDVETEFKAAAAKLDAAKAAVVTEISNAEAKVSSLKSLI